MITLFSTLRHPAYLGKAILFHKFLLAVADILCPRYQYDLINKAVLKRFQGIIQNRLSSHQKILLLGAATHSLPAACSKYYSATPVLFLFHMQISLSQFKMILPDFIQAGSITPEFISLLV